MEPDVVAKDEPFDLGAVRFEFGATIDKAWQDEKTGKMHVRAIASDDQMDLQRDRMSSRALERMAEMSKAGVPLLDNHRATFEFGKTVHGQVLTTQAADGRPVRQLLVELELDGEWPQARKLFREVSGGECARQLSIGGKLNLKNRDAVTVQMTSGGLSRTINDLDLDHIATTRKAQAANPRTSFVEAIAKSLDAAMEAGWEPEVQNPLAKEDGPGQNTPSSAMDSPDDIQLGARILASVGKASRGGSVAKMDMNGGETPGATPDEMETTPGEPATPEAEGSGGMEKAKKKVRDPKALAAAIGRAKYGKKRFQEMAATGRRKASKDLPDDDAFLKALDEIADGEFEDLVRAAVDFYGEDLDKAQMGQKVKPGSLKGPPHEPSSKAPPGKGKRFEALVEELEEKAMHDKSQKADGVKDPKTLPEQEALKPEAKKYGYAKTQMLGEISSLLTKMESGGETGGEPEDAEAKELRGIRDRLLKMVSGASSGPGEKPSADEIAGHGAGAYEQDTSAAKPGYSPDKAPKGDSTDVAGTNVTGHQNNIQVGGEIEPSAPTAKAEYAHTMSWLRQGGVVKALGEDGVAGIEKALGSAVDAAVEKSLDITQQVVVAAVEKVLEEQGAASAAIHKSIEGFGASLNDVVRRLAAAEAQAAEISQLKAKVARIEKSGGVSQSGPRGGSDAALPRQGAKSGGVWTGLFNKPVAEATGSY